MPTDLPFSVADRRKRGYFTIDNVLLDIYGERLTPYGIAAYACLARFANSDQQCWPSMETIAKRTGMSSRHARRMIGLLAELNIISITPQYNPQTKEHTSNLYTLLDIVGGTDSESVGGTDQQSAPSDQQSHRTKPKKKGHTKEDKKKDYRPLEYMDYIL